MTTRSPASIAAHVQELLDRQVAEGRQIGVQVAAYQAGRQIVSAVAGAMGKRDPRPVQEDSLFNCWSTTKGVAAALVHVLADKGVLEYDAPVAKYWPAFAKNGKERITVEQAMSHQSGLHAAPAPYTNETISDWEGCLRYIEDLAPAYEPGTATGYHAFTYAWVVGGIVEGATGRRFQEVLRTELAEPLGLAEELYIGIPDGVEDRLTTLSAAPIDPNAALLYKPGKYYAEAMPLKFSWSFNDMTVRKACIPSANGHFTARALARLYGALANGGAIDGVRLVPPERIVDMQRLVTDGMDQVLGVRARKGIGFWLGGEVDGVPSVFGPRQTAFGHSGNGGSTGFADPEMGLGVGVTINLMQPNLEGGGPTMEICELVRTLVG